MCGCAVLSTLMRSTPRARTAKHTNTQIQGGEVTLGDVINPSSAIHSQTELAHHSRLHRLSFNSRPLHQPQLGRATTMHGPFSVSPETGRKEGN